MNSEDDGQVVIHERVVIRKFEGVPVPDSVPFEVVVVEDGVIVPGDDVPSVEGDPDAAD